MESLVKTIDRVQINPYPVQASIEVRLPEGSFLVGPLVATDSQIRGNKNAVDTPEPAVEAGRIERRSSYPPTTRVD